jgi:hypothetical protein
VSESTPDITEQAPVESPTPVKEFPGQTLGVVALILSFFLQIPALIMGIVAWNWSNRAGVSNTPAKVAVFVSIGLILLGILVLVGWTIALVSFGPMFEEAFLQTL